MFLYRSGLKARDGRILVAGIRRAGNQKDFWRGWPWIAYACGMTIESLVNALLQEALKLVEVEDVR